MNGNLLSTRGGALFSSSFDHKIRTTFNRSMIEALGHVYYSRLSRKSRAQYLNHIAATANNFSLYTFSSGHFVKQLHSTQRYV